MSEPTLGELALRVGGEVRGDASLAIQGVAAIRKAGPNDITFAGDEKHLRLLAASGAGACLVGRKYRDSSLLAGLSMALVFVDDPQDACLTLASDFRPEVAAASIGISPRAIISQSAQIGADCEIYTGVFVDDGAVLGSGCVLHPGVYIGRNCKIGNQ